jgi:hypothetical protein
MIQIHYVNHFFFFEKQNIEIIVNELLVGLSRYAHSDTIILSSMRYLNVASILKRMLLQLCGQWKRRCWAVC